MISIGQINLSNLPAKFCAVGPKMKKFWKFSRKFWDLLIKISMENWLIHIFSKYFLDFWLLSESIYLWKITPDFYNNFSYFWERERSGVPPLPTLLTSLGKFSKSSPENCSSNRINNFPLSGLNWVNIKKFIFFLNWTSVNIENFHVTITFFTILPISSFFLSLSLSDVLFYIP